MIDIINKSCLDVMSDMKDNYIDLTVTSPPYDNLRSYEGSLEWNEDVWRNIIEELYRVTKKGGVVVWVVGDATIEGSETGTSFKQVLYAMACGFNLHDTMIWTKDGGGAIGSNNTYTQNFEYMFVFSKGKIKTVNLIRDKINKSFMQGELKTGRRKRSGELKKEVRPDKKRFSKRNNYWYIPPSEGSMNHPAVFPEKLVRDHILSWSNEGDLIFDPFLGSGTTAKVAIDLKRSVIGSEIVKKYYKIALKRIEDSKRAWF